MARWRILDGPNELPNTGGVDGDLAGFMIENQNDPAQRRHVVVVISRSVLASDPHGLISDIAKAVETNGVSALERFLDEVDPPARVMVTSTSIYPAEQ